MSIEILSFTMAFGEEGIGAQSFEYRGSRSATCEGVEFFEAGFSALMTGNY
jgi:hypothetical protein